jgi:caa(3)-type oxidase subunit IV
MAKHKEAHSHDVVHADHERPNVKLYVGIFAALMVLTGLTVFVSKFHLPRPQAIALGLLIACTKASLVGAVFMHLWGEKKMIHRFLYTAGFFGVLMLIPITDFVLTDHQHLDHANVAAEHPDEGKVESAGESTINLEKAPEKPAEAPKPASKKAKAKAKGK